MAVDLFDAISGASFLSLKITCFIAIMRYLVKDFITKVNITTRNHQSAYQFKYETLTSHKSKASQLAQKVPPIFPLHKKIRLCFHCTIRFANISTSRKDSPLSHTGVDFKGAVYHQLVLSLIANLSGARRR